MRRTVLRVKVSPLWVIYSQSISSRIKRSGGVAARHRSLLLVPVLATALIAPAAAHAAAQAQPLPLPGFTGEQPAEQPSEELTRLMAPLLLTEGDSRGLHLLKGTESEDGVDWHALGTFGHEAIETDRWIGQACVTGSGTHAVVVYAPRQFTNRAPLFDRAAHVAVVDLQTGQRGPTPKLRAMFLASTARSRSAAKTASVATKPAECQPDRG